MSSWNRELATNKLYEIINNNTWDHWRVKNEYQKYKCPKCTEYIWCRLTHIVTIKNEEIIQVSHHNNHKNSYEEFKELPVQYIGESSVIERKENNTWKLISNDAVFGIENTEKNYLCN